MSRSLPDRTTEMEIVLSFDQLFAVVIISLSLGTLAGYYARKTSDKENHS